MPDLLKFILIQGLHKGKKGKWNKCNAPHFKIFNKLSPYHKFKIITSLIYFLDDSMPTPKGCQSLQNWPGELTSGQLTGSSQEYFVNGKMVKTMAL